MAPAVTTKTDTKPAARPLPANLVDIALIDASTCAAPGDLSVSWWLEEVRAGRAPQPVIRKPRCTRWRLVDVRTFWVEFATQGERDIEAGERMTARAKKASAAAQAKRARATLAAGGAGQ